MKTEIFKYCPFCGSEIVNFQPRWFQCTNEECGEVFVVLETEFGLRMQHIRTPFSKMEKEEENENTNT